ncbi:hypothetical protein HFN89_06780 [Rhizobium laguerreae]|nr:hypothetical protein [Rhizobium laguerreae]
MASAYANWYMPPSFHFVQLGSQLKTSVGCVKKELKDAIDLAGVNLYEAVDC